MPLFVKFAYWEAVLPFGGSLGVVLWMSLTGQHPSELPARRRRSRPKQCAWVSSQASTGRAQTLVVTLFVAGYDLLQVIRNPTELPQLPVPMVMALGASHAFYLAGKARDRFKGR
jgi:hypothetical protein